MGAPYRGTEASGYLVTTHGFAFVEVDDPVVKEAQDALYQQAARLARWRTAVVRLIDKQHENNGYMRVAMQKGELWYPLGDVPSPDPATLVRRIEDEEHAVRLWCRVVAELQAQATA